MACRKLQSVTYTGIFAQRLLKSSPHQSNFPSVSFGDLPWQLWHGQCGRRLSPSCTSQDRLCRSAAVAPSGIGKATAIALHRGSADVFALDKNEASLDALRKEVPGIHTICVDLRDWTATKQAVSALGCIDMLVNNAGLWCTESFLDVTPDAYDEMMDVHAKATLNVSQVVAKSMIEQGKGGSIVNTSSKASYGALKQHAAYAASKSAVDAMSRVMALELGPHQIRVNTIHPTVVMTDLNRQIWGEPKKRDDMLSKIPMGKFAEVKDVVHTILYLLSDKADMITGAHIPIDGGFLAC